MSDITWQTPQPTNYTGLMIQPDPIGSFQKAAALQNTQAQTGLLNAQAQNTQQVALQNSLAVQRQQNFQQQWQQFSQNPTPQGAVQMAMANPEWAQQVSGAWGNYNEQQRQQKLDLISPIAAALQNGNYNVANNRLQDYIDAIQNTQQTGGDTPEMQHDLQQAKGMQDLVQGDIQNGTKNALSVAYGTLAAAMGPQDFMTHYGQGATMGTSINQAAANLDQTQAHTADIYSTIQNRAAQFGLDAQKLQADVAFKLKDMNYHYNAPYMQPEARAQADQDAVNSVSYGQMAQRMGNLSQQIGVLDQNGQWSAGVGGRVQQAWQNFWGTQDNVSTMKQEYAQVMGTLGAFGGAGLSKSDQKNLEPGIPPQNAAPQQIQQFMQSFQNAELRAARISDAKSSWAYTYGRMGPATSDQTVGGIQVARGTSFPKYMNQLLQANSAAPSAFPAPNAAPGVQVNPTASGSQPGGPLTGNYSRYNRYVQGQ